MPTVISSPCSDPVQGTVPTSARLPKGHVWVPAGDLPAALRALELLQSVPSPEDAALPPGMDSI